MNYQEFLAYVKENILEYLDFEPDAVVEVHTLIKNNGISMDGLSVRRPGELMAPNIYLNPFYTEYESGRDAEEILADIARRYRTYQRRVDVDPDDIADFDKVQERIVLRVVGFEANKEQLLNCPYIMLQDMAITFRWLVSMEPCGIATVQITNKEQKKWGVSLEDLYTLALENTRRIFPPQIKPLGSMLVGYLEEVVESGSMDKEQVDEVQEEIAEYIASESSQPPLYVLTNTIGINGATCIVYKDILEEFSARLGYNLYILPSSIHELILIPDNGEFDPKEMHKMVHEANTTVVCPGDVLTDSVYYYNRAEATLKKI